MADAGNDNSQTRAAHDIAHFDLAERAARFGYWRSELADGSTYWSPGMYRLLGVDPSMPPDSDWLLEQMLPQDKRAVQEAIATAIRTRSPFAYRTRAKDPNVAAQIVDTQGELAIGADGRVVSVIGVCYDVTLQVRAEEARERAQRMYRLMTEEASDIIILYGEDGRVLFASQALERVLGYAVADIEGDRVLPLIHPDDIGRDPEESRERPAAGRYADRDLSHEARRRSLRLDRGDDARGVRRRKRQPQRRQRRARRDEPQAAGDRDATPHANAPRPPTAPSRASSPI